MTVKGKISGMLVLWVYSCEDPHASVIWVVALLLIQLPVKNYVDYCRPCNSAACFPVRLRVFMSPDIPFFLLNAVISSHRGIPNYDFKIGRITFIRNSRPQPKKFVEDVRNVMFLFRSHVALECTNIFRIILFYMYPCIFPLCFKDDAVNKFIAFSGEGQSLRKKGRKPWNISAPWLICRSWP